MSLFCHQFEYHTAIVVALAQVVYRVVALKSTCELGNDNSLIHQQAATDNLAFDGKSLTLLLGCNLAYAVVSLGIKTLQADNAMRHAEGVEDLLAKFRNYPSVS